VLISETDQWYVFVFVSANELSGWVANTPKERKKVCVLLLIGL